MHRQYCPAGSASAELALYLYKGSDFLSFYIMPGKFAHTCF